MRQHSINRNNTSGYRGVTFWRGKFSARIYVHPKYVFLGYFPDAKVAARAYDRAVWKYHGDEGWWNFPQ